MKMKTKLLALLLCASSAFAGTTSTVVGGISVFHPIDVPNAAAVTYKDAAGKTAHDLCVAAANAYVGKATCSDVATYTTVASCSDVPKPAFPVKVDATGYLTVPDIRVQVLANGTDWAPPEIQAMVPAPYPKCWDIGWVPYTGQEYTTDTEGEPSMDPLTWPQELQAKWDSDASQVRRHDNHVCYTEDTLPCPVAW